MLEFTVTAMCLHCKLVNILINGSLFHALLVLFRIKRSSKVEEPILKEMLDAGCAQHMKVHTTRNVTDNSMINYHIESDSLNVYLYHRLDLY